MEFLGVVTKLTQPVYGISWVFLTLAMPAPHNKQVCLIQGGFHEIVQGLQIVHLNGSWVFNQ
jgi:hypothetical protein